MRFKVTILAVAFTLTSQAENVPHVLAAFSPFAGRPSRQVVCDPNQAQSNFRTGPRAQLLDELVELIEIKFNEVRSQVSPNLPDDQVAQELVDTNPAVIRLLLRHNLSQKETAELMKRWNDKYLHGAVKLPAENTGFKNWLEKAFTDLYEMPNLDDRTKRFEGAIAQEEAARMALIQKAVQSGKPDLKALSESIVRSKGLVDALNALQTSLVGRLVPGPNSVTDYLRRR